jgi:hypothetical protein
MFSTATEAVSYFLTSALAASGLASACFSAFASAGFSTYFSALTSVFSLGTTADKDNFSLADYST